MKVEEPFVLDIPFANRRYRRTSKKNRQKIYVGMFVFILAMFMFIVFSKDTTGRGLSVDQMSKIKSD